MSKFIWISVIVILGGSFVSSDKVIICYYGTWATYRWGLGQFNVDDINVDLCTHLVYTFVGLNTDGSVMSLDPYLDLPDNYGRDNFGEFASLKQKNPNLKTVLSVGGWNEGSGKYSVMAANANLRQTFVDSALNMLLEYGFDGFDIDWEYPNRRDTVNGQADVDNFTQLLKELKAALEPHGLLLTIAASATEASASLSYDIPGISQYVDYINIMAYDMYGAWDPNTGHNAPLHTGLAGEVFTVEAALQYWLDAGCPPSKMILGLPLYGRTFTLTDAAVNGVGAPASGAGIAGTFTATNGLIGYNELCNKLQTETWDVRYDSLAMVPYAVQENNWVSYDDTNSLMAKIEYGLSLGIGGVMVWSIETDDFHALCHDEDFPLLRAINKALGRAVDEQSTTASTTTASSSTEVTTTTTTVQPSSSTTETVTTSTSENPITTTASPTSVTTSESPSSSSGTETTTTASTSSSSSSSTTVLPTTVSSTTVSSTTASSTTPSSTTASSTTVLSTTVPSADCKEEGIISHPEDCSKFLYCITDENGSLKAVEFVCPITLLWDQNILACNFADRVNCQQ